MADPRPFARGELFSRRLARYLSHCCVNEFSFIHGDLVNAIGRYTQGNEVGAMVLKNPKPKFEMASALPFITWQHELSHYRTLVSTGTGVFLWRLNTEILSTAAFMVRRINKSSAGSTIRAPFQKWYETEGKARIAADPPYDPAVAYAQGLTEAQFRMRSPLHMQIKSIELDRLTRFRDAFMATTLVSMREFVELGNSVVPILAARSEVPIHQKFRWSARDLNRASQLPEPAFTMTELLEADARFHEHMLLLQLGASPAEIGDWRKKYIVGLYKPAYEWLIAELGDPRLALVALDQAFNGPADPGAVTAFNGEAMVEDVHPSWRLLRAVRALQDEFWPWKPEDRAAMISTGISRNAGMPAPFDVAKALLEHPIHSETALTADAILAGIKPEATVAPYVQYAESAIRFALQYRKDDPLAIIAPSKPFGLKPLVEFFQDCAVLNMYAMRNGEMYRLLQSPDLLPMLMTELISGLSLFALMTDGDVEDLARFEKSYQAELRVSGFDEPIKNARLEVREIVSQTLGKGAADSLYWND